MGLALLFDLDGTLFETLSAIVTAMNEALGEQGDARPFTAAELRPFIGRPVQHQLDVLRGITGPRADAFADSYYRHFMATVERGVRLVPGVPETFPLLAGRRIGTMTTRRRREARRMLELAGLLPYFTEVVGGDQVSRPKPAPDLSRYSARAVGVRPEESVVVGDSFVDILAGRAAGAWTVAAVYGYGERSALRDARPDAEIESFTDLPSVLRTLESRDRRPATGIDDFP